MTNAAFKTQQYGFLIQLKYGHQIQDCLALSGCTLNWIMFHPLIMFDQSFFQSSFHVA